MAKKLKIGEEFENLRQLCKALGLEYSSSAQVRRNALKEIDRQYIYHKVGQKIIIDGYVKPNTVTVKVCDTDMEQFTKYLEDRGYDYKVK